MVDFLLEVAVQSEAEKSRDNRMKIGSVQAYIEILKRTGDRSTATSPIATNDREAK